MKNLTHEFAGLILVFVSCLICGCAGYLDLPAGTVRQVSSPIVEKQEVTVPALEEEPPPSEDYIIGVNDVLNVTSNCPTQFTGARLEAVRIGDMPSGTIQGSRVDGSGNIQLPRVGLVNVAGLTLAKAQSVIKESLRKFVKDPWVVVEVVEFRSKPIYLLGQFKKPGTFYLDRHLNLTQGIALGSGFEPTAYLRGARLNRNNKIMPVDIYDLLLNGHPSQNILLKPGDTIFIPDNSNQQVFVFGAVKKPGPVPMLQSGLNLAQAIGSAELRDTGFDFKHVRIIRSLSATRGELIVVDFDRILRGDALPMPLMEGDIVYVPRSNMGAWNDAINEMLPSLQAISAVLQPFVQLEFLRRE
ncbi:MAG: polysaccharide biosynthesis/export family protein [Geobacteraceae bacterium]